MTKGILAIGILFNNTGPGGWEAWVKLDCKAYMLSSFFNLKIVNILYHYECLFRSTLIAEQIYLSNLGAGKTCFFILKKYIQVNEWYDKYEYLRDITS